MVIKMKIRNLGHLKEPMAYIKIGITYLVNSNNQYNIQYSVDAAWCNFFLDHLTRDTIRTVKLWQDATNKITGWKCF